MANFLRDFRPKKPFSMGGNFQAMADNAPVGSVGAPGGLLAPRQSTRTNALAGLLAAGSAVPGVGDAVGLLGDAAMYASDPKSRTLGNALMTGLGALPFVPSVSQLAEIAGPLSAMVVYHSSPHKFNAFDLSKVGTGEGAQVYGRGAYLAESPAVGGKGGAYYKAFESHPAAAKGGGPYAYTVDLPDEAIAKMLDWDAPLSEQVPEVRDAARALLSGMVEQAPYRGGWGDLVGDGEQLRELITPEGIPLGLYSKAEADALDVPGSVVLKAISKGDKESQAAAEKLRKAGIPGIKYFDGGSRGTGQGTRNFVVFDDKLPKILKRE